MSEETLQGKVEWSKDIGESEEDSGDLSSCKATKGDLKDESHG